MTPKLWNAFESVVKSSRASQLYRNNSTDQEYQEYLLVMTEWVSRMVMYLYGPCTCAKTLDSGGRRCHDRGSTISQVLFKYTSRYMYNSFEYLFMYQMQLAGVSLSEDLHPVQVIYRSKLRKTGLMREFTKMREAGRDPWKELSDTVTEAITGHDPSSTLNLRLSLMGRLNDNENSVPQL